MENIKSKKEIIVNNVEEIRILQSKIDEFRLINSLSSRVKMHLETLGLLESVSLKPDGSCVFILETNNPLQDNSKIENMLKELFLKSQQSIQKRCIIDWVRAKRSNPYNNISHIYTDWNVDQKLNRFKK